MIIIDLNESKQNLILTLSESVKTLGSVIFTMVLKHDSTRSEHSIILPDNVSISIERYDLFRMNTLDFQGMEKGFYSFKIFVNDDETNSIEDGKLLLKDSGDKVKDNEYIIHKIN